MPADKGQSPNYKPRADFKRSGQQIEAAMPAPAIVNNAEQLGTFLLERADLAELEVYSDKEGKAALAYELAKMLFKQEYAAGVDAIELTQAYLEDRAMSEETSNEQTIPTLYVVTATPLENMSRRIGFGA